MSDIYEPTSKFDFNKLILKKPILISGNYFIKYSVDEKPLYIQPPKSSIKQLILHKSSKKSYCDLLFSQENQEFIEWMETLEQHSQQSIFKHRKEWFENELEMEDIENSFTSPMKSYKSGTYYVCRTNMTQRLGKINVKIYDESETDIPVEDVSGNMNAITILELQGIKCSAKSFQIEIELKQMMVLNQVDLFDKCILKKTNNKPYEKHETIMTYDEPLTVMQNNSLEESNNKNKNQTNESLDIDLGKMNEDIVPPNKFDKEDQEQQQEQEDEIISFVEETPNNTELTEIDFDLAEIPNTETIQIKARDDVYYQLYREAKKKARIAKDLALSAYLEANEIKNKYMLDVSDSETEDEDS